MDETLLTLAALLPARQRGQALGVCAEVIAIAPGLPGGQPGRAARSAALLLLEMALPDSDAQLRRAMAQACERVVAVSH